MAQSFACGRGYRASEPDLNIGDKVRRKSGKTVTGEVVGFIRDSYGRLRAKVKWPDNTRIGGNGFSHSTVAVSTLVKVEAAQ